MFVLNKSFSKLLPTTVAEASRLIKIAFIMVALLITTKLVSIKIEDFSSKKEKTHLETISSQNEYQNLKSDIKSKEQHLIELGNLTSKLIDKDSFITFIGKTTDAAGISIVSLESGDVKSTDSVVSVNFKMELLGKISSVGEIISAIDSLGTAYNIKELSIRKEGKYLWLDREFHQSGQSWMQFEKNSVAALNPQNIPLPESLPEVVLNEQGEIIEIKDSRLTGTDDLLNGDKISIYLEISFLIAR